MQQMYNFKYDLRKNIIKKTRYLTIFDKTFLSLDKE